MLRNMEMENTIRNKLAIKKRKKHFQIQTKGDTKKYKKWVVAKKFKEDNMKNMHQEDINQAVKKYEAKYEL